ncbi:MAG TPA: DUF3775 domain-containing protein [Thermohalobaculum sp.]|nr:DUF3775 domain-containing protein [Thermohalobaculum sp.]
MLTIPLSTVAWIILKAREFDVKDVSTDDDNNDIDNPASVLEDRRGDPSQDELTSWISDLNVQQQAELVALFWLGRDDGDADDFPGLVEQAQGQQGSGTARYLLGSPLLGDYLEEGLEKLGVDTSEIESESV